MKPGSARGDLPDLSGQVAVVTGASRGIGRGLALGLARAGAAVVVAARTTTQVPGGLPGTIYSTAAEIEAAGGQALALRCDVSSPQDLEALVATTLERFSRLDVLINNAMAPTRGAIEEVSLSAWDEAMSTNVRSLFTSTRAVLPAMREAGGGSIVNISSGAADHRSTPFLPPGYWMYAVAKAALERFSTVMAPELGRFGIAINALRPGAVKTELAVRELGEDHDWTGWSQPEAVVPAVVWLAAQRGDGFTGQVVDSTQFGKSWP